MSSSKTSCCVIGCGNTAKNTINQTPRIKFYLFPCLSVHTPWKTLKRVKWITAIKRNTSCSKDWQPSKFSRICSAHFYQNEKSEHPLHPSYLPTIFNGKYNERKLKNHLGRFHRKMRRDQRQQVTQKIPKKDKSPVNKRQKILITPENSKIDELPTVNMEINEDILDEKHNLTDVGCQTGDDLPETNDTNCESYDSGFRIIQGYVCDVAIQVFIKMEPKLMNKPTNTETLANDNKATKDSCINCSDLRSISCTGGFHGITSIKTDNEIRSLTGIPFGAFNLLLKIISPTRELELDKQNKLLLFLMKMRLGLSFSALACLFSLNSKNPQRIFHEILKCLRILLQNALKWPPRKDIPVIAMPKSLKKRCQTTRVIIDCTEISIETANNVGDQKLLDSDDKRNETVKFLVGCTPNGFISFVSDAYDGRATDSVVTVDSGLLDLLEPGDAVIANRSLSHIDTNVSEKQVILLMPPCATKNQSLEEIREKNYIDSLRIRIERKIRQIKGFQIFDKISTDLVTDVNDIMFVACALINMSETIVKNATGN